MPLASDGKRLFPIEQTNSYGRVMLDRQREIHDDLIGRAPLVVEDRVKPIYMKQLQVLHKAERFKPSYNQMKQRQDDDIVMTNLIRDAKCTSVNRLDGHILRFRELRQKHPNFIPGWLKRYEDTKSMEVHDRIILKSRKWIDDEPPVRALNYRSVLQKTPFTKGGFPRVVNTMPRRKRRRAKNSANSLPPRRSASSMSHSRKSSQSTTPKGRSQLRTAPEEARRESEGLGDYSPDTRSHVQSEPAASSEPEPTQHFEEPAVEKPAAVEEPAAEKPAAVEEPAAEKPAAVEQPAAVEDVARGDAGQSQSAAVETQGAEADAYMDDFEDGDAEQAADSLVDPELLAATNEQAAAREEEEEDDYGDEFDSDGEGSAYDQSNDNLEHSMDREKSKANEK